MLIGIIPLYITRKVYFDYDPFYQLPVSVFSLTVDVSVASNSCTSNLELVTLAHWHTLRPQSSTANYLLPILGLLIVTLQYITYINIYSCSALILLILLLTNPCFSYAKVEFIPSGFLQPLGDKYCIICRYFHSPQIYFLRSFEFSSLFG